MKNDENQQLIERFKQAIKDIEDLPSAEVHPRLVKAQVDSLKSVLRDLEIGDDEIDVDL